MKDFALQKYRELGDIITESFLYVRLHYKTLGKGLLFFVLPFYLVSAVLVGDSYSSFFADAFTDPENFDFLISGEMWLGMLFMIFASGALYTITLKHIQLARDYEEFETSDLLEDFGINLFTLVILYLLIVFAVVFSLFLFIIPGIFIGVKLFIAPAVAILERKNPFEALGRSWNLVEGHWWFTFATFVVMYIITTFMSYILVIPFSIIMGFITASGVDAQSGILGTGLELFYGLIVIIASLFSVILLIAMGLHYFNLVERKEGLGLQSQIEELN